MLQLRTQYLSSSRRLNKFFWRQNLIERQLTIALIVEMFADIYVQYNTITLFKEGSAIACYSFLTYGPQKNR